MKDQVEALEARGISAARLDSSLEPAEAASVYDRIRTGTLKLLYIAPERLMSEQFVGRLARAKVAMMAVDEAHCISEWGHNFRPEYLRLAYVARELGIGPVLALTATATPAVAADIRRAFGIAETDHVQTSFRRPNLSYRVTPCAARDRLALLTSRLESRQGEEKGATIVYVTLQKTAEEVARHLQQSGLAALPYHTGLPAIRAAAERVRPLALRTRPGHRHPPAGDRDGAHPSGAGRNHPAPGLVLCRLPVSAARARGGPAGQTHA